MSRTLPSSLAVIASLAIASTAWATVMVEVPLEELVQTADVIVHGTVVSSRARVEVRDGALEPQTVTTLRVHEWIAGPGGETVELRELGGTWQGGGVRYDGTPEYRPGEEVVVFLERRPEAPHDLRTLAMVQGKFLVRHGVPGVPARVHRDLTGISFARWADGRQTVEAPGDAPAMELSAFLGYVRDVRGAR
ncbi:MAG: hypothetical protein M5U28_53580 [Sandaracinaceae bacterium]|nr:hypothetical protein [Sandaracinaceae bacterium]